MPDMTDRHHMIQAQIAGPRVCGPNILAAMREVPCEACVSPGREELAHQDDPLPIVQDQTLPQPCHVTPMIGAARIRPGQRVLEIATGSGHAAAVTAGIGAQVHTAGRHGALAAGRRPARAGCDGIAMHVGDGTPGRPEAAPFGAPVVAAGGLPVRQAPKNPLKEGGRLVIPADGSARGQALLRLTRSGGRREEHPAAVGSMPLIGARGLPEDGTRAAGTHAPARACAQSLPEMIAAAAEPLPGPDDPAFGQAFDRYGGRRVVLLGEASHGTSEFYRARAAITRHLIEHHGFTIVAVEADWPDAATVDRHVGHRPPREGAEPPFLRFPSWMWRNTDVEAFIHWLRDHNGAADRRVRFHGLDIYNMRGSIAAVLEYLDGIDPDAARIARERYGCLTPWQSNPAVHGRAVLSRRHRNCEAEVAAQLRALLEKRTDYEAADGAGFLDAAQNARLIRSAERYYRIMHHGGAESWNLRDTHMFETLEHVLAAHGGAARAVVWAHNSHIGDARATGMGAVRGEINLGQLARERFGAEAALIGFGTHTGTVAAATDWGGDMEVKRVRPSREGSYERLCHDSGRARFLLDLKRDPALRQRLEEQRLERFIGVIYRPETELMSHYAEAALARQFDAWVWFDETSAVTPLGPEHWRAGVPETYPFGL